MTREEHRQRAEQLLEEATSDSQNALDEGWSERVTRAVDQDIAMAHVHALLSLAVNTP